MSILEDGIWSLTRDTLKMPTIWSTVKNQQIKQKFCVSDLVPQMIVPCVVDRYLRRKKFLHSKFLQSVKVKLAIILPGKKWCDLNSSICRGIFPDFFLFSVCCDLTWKANFTANEENQAENKEKNLIRLVKRKRKHKTLQTLKQAIKSYFNYNSNKQTETN